MLSFVSERRRDRSYVPVEPEYHKCVVPGCLGWFRTLDKNGMCPLDLWPLDHFDYAKQLAEKSA